MYTRTHSDVAGTETDVIWGNGTSLRLLTTRDNMGFTICYTTVWKGTRSRLQYRNHLEACYCISGFGQIADPFTGYVLDIQPGTLYVLDQHDDHFLIAGEEQDLILLSVFTPPLNGTEVHNLNNDGGSHY
ncbi:MAG: L-ectoine synthase (EC [uncultured Paraburkholderia sp.]|nr:MAG: L-ectoine synthase (EC [uncultured Paraburkholderia sp.]